MVNLSLFIGSPLFALVHTFTIVTIILVVIFALNGFSVNWDFHAFIVYHGFYSREHLEKVQNYEPRTLIRSF